MRTDELDYHLPEELIALRPAQRRSEARLLVVRSKELVHRSVRDLPKLLRAGDLLVFNDTRVLPARLELRRSRTGGRVEGLFLGPAPGGEGRWRLMLKSGGRLVEGETLLFEDEAVVRLIEKEPAGVWSVQQLGPDLPALLDRIGTMPLPPYIRSRRSENLESLDRERYQTVFARHAGAVAAPTAGLHFDRPLLEALHAAGVQTTRLTLHVGAGTFTPIRAERLQDHRMHAETYEVSARTVGMLLAARAENRRIIPVGTTCVRALESLPDPLEEKDFQGDSELMIRPPFEFRFTDGLMTNFHLPRSTLLALVAAKVGLERLKTVYEEAVRKGYRFYSYGDAMLVLDE